MKYYFISLFLCLFFSVHSNVSAEVIDVKYSFLGNYEGKIFIPESDERLPAIIYNYDEYLEAVGEDIARKKGYNLYKIASLFAKWGYITFVPMKRRQQVNSIKGALKYLSHHDKVDPNRIHLIGVSEGAFLSLLATEGIYKPRSLIMIVPVPPHAKGKYSLPEVLRQVDAFTMPTFIITGRMDLTWKQHYGEIIRDVLKQYNLPYHHKSYMRAKWWFWNPEHYFMDDIYTFLLNNS